MSVRRWFAILALLLPSPLFGGCVLFKELVELDEYAGRYLRASEIETGDRQAALSTAVAVVDGMLEGLDPGGLEEFLEVRRQLARSEVSQMSQRAHEDFLVRLHRTRRDLPPYGEVWGCLDRSAEKNPVGQPGGVELMPRTDTAVPLRSQDQHRAMPESQRSSGGASNSYLSALWLLLAGSAVIFGLVRWETRRAFMRERHICNVPCMVEDDAGCIRATIADLSMVGAKLRFSDGATPPTTRTASRLVLNGRQVAFEVVWRTSHFMRVRFQKPIPRKLVIGLSSGLQRRAGADARRNLQGAGQDAVSGRPGAAPVPGSARARDKPFA